MQSIYISIDLHHCVRETLRNSLIASRAESEPFEADIDLTLDGHFPTLKDDDPAAPLDSTLSFQLTL
jgi:hypothetical protein